MANEHFRDNKNLLWNAALDKNLLFSFPLFRSMFARHELNLLSLVERYVLICGMFGLINIGLLSECAFGSCKSSPELITDSNE